MLYRRRSEIWEFVLFILLFSVSCIYSSYASNEQETDTQSINKKRTRSQESFLPTGLSSSVWPSSFLSNTGQDLGESQPKLLKSSKNQTFSNLEITKEDLAFQALPSSPQLNALFHETEANQVQSTQTINDMPTEILLQILSLLKVEEWYITRGVSHLWKDCSDKLIIEETEAKSAIEGNYGEFDLDSLKEVAVGNNIDIPDYLANVNTYKQLAEIIKEGTSIEKIDINIAHGILHITNEDIALNYPYETPIEEQNLRVQNLIRTHKLSIQENGIIDLLEEKIAELGFENCFLLHSMNLIQFMRVNLMGSFTFISSQFLKTFKYLFYLDIGSPNLMFFPESIRELTNLKRLTIFETGIFSLPSSIGELTNLEILNLCNNQIRLIPPEIEKLTKLRLLNLGDNNLTILPIQIGQLINLEKLYIQDNNLEFLPKEISNLSNLRVLTFDRNKISSEKEEEVYDWFLSNSQNIEFSGDEEFDFDSDEIEDTDEGEDE